MKFTSTLEQDALIAPDIEKIIKAASKGTFKSLVMFGSTAKGEGYVHDGRVNDYDLVLVDGDKKAWKMLEKLNLGCEVDILNVQSNALEKLPCTQMWWEIKYGSILLAGEPLKLPLWQPWDIPYYDAVVSIDKRIVSMLIGKHEMMKDQPDWRKVTEQICKGIIAIGDATLIKRGQFHHLYAKRALMLSQDEISGLYTLAVSMKTLGTPELSADSLWETWHRTKKLIEEYIVINQLNIPKAEILFSVTDRTTREELAKILKQLGAESWL